MSLNPLKILGGAEGESHSLACSLHEGIGSPRGIP
jgi:hypothetical protein